MKTIRNLIGAACLASAVALGGCASTGTSTGTSTTASDITATIAQVQQAAVAACAFLPTTATVANLIGTATGVGAETQLATTIASQICAAVSATTTNGARRAGAVPTVHGVVIHGRFVG